MSRTKRDVDPAELQAEIARLEKKTNYANRSALYAALAETKWARENGVTASVAYLRVGEFGTIIQTPQGKRGRKPGAIRSMDSGIPGFGSIPPAPRSQTNTTDKSTTPAPRVPPAGSPVKRGVPVKHLPPAPALPDTPKRGHPPIDVWELVDIFTEHDIDVFGWPDILTSDFDDDATRHRKRAAWKTLRERYTTLRTSAGKRHDS